jgi:hypothetical protein
MATLPMSIKGLLSKTKGPHQTGKYRVTLDNCGKKMKSKVGTVGDREKNRRLKQIANRIFKKTWTELENQLHPIPNNFGDKNV